MKRCGSNTWPMSERIHGNDHSIKQQNLRCYSAKENCRSRCSLEVVILGYCLLKFNYKYKRILTYRPGNIRFAREIVKQQLIWRKIFWLKGGSERWEIGRSTKIDRNY